MVGPATVRDFVVIREERSGDLTLSLKRLELQVGGRQRAEAGRAHMAAAWAVQGTSGSSMARAEQGLSGSSISIA